LQAGSRIVQLKPAELVFDDTSDTLPVMMMMMELSRGNGESRIKSERVGAAFRKKKKEAREAGVLMTHQLPAWVRADEEGKMHLIEDRAEVVRRIFDLAANGHGKALIVKILTEEGVEPWGWCRRQSRQPTWNKAYVGKILKDRRALGELQPRLRDGRKDGEAFLYYPPVVKEEQWLTVQRAMATRRQHRGRIGENVNPFSGLLREAVHGGAYFIGTATGGSDKSKRYKVLVNNEGSERRAPYVTFPYHEFEAHMLDKLREIDPGEVIGEPPAGPDEVRILAAELTRIEAAIALIEADLNEHGESPTLFRRIRAKEEEKRAVAGKLAEARRKAAHPLSESWGEVRSLVEALGSAPDHREARLRLRAALRRVVEPILLVVVPRGRQRLCAVQIRFTGDGHRDYLILYRPGWSDGKRHRESRSAVRSFAEVSLPEDLDLRNPDHAARMQRALADVVW
jgi:hypothetical protein